MERRVSTRDTKIQVNVYVPETTYLELLEYSRSLGVEKSTLANLLALRALKTTSLQSEVRLIPSGNKRKITIRLPSPKHKDRFRALARSFDVSESQLATLLIVDELKHRSLRAWMNREALTQFESRDMLKE